MSAPLTWLVGQVQALNDRGIKLNDGWVNRSKFAKPEAIQAVRVGAWVELAVDSSGFYRSLVAKSSTTAAAAEPPCHEPSADNLPTVEHQAMSKDRLIVRQVAIKCASKFMSLRTDLRSCDMLALAEQIERWILR
jgi:hypothetical protein